MARQVLTIPDTPGPLLTQTEGDARYLQAGAAGDPLPQYQISAEVDAAITAAVNAHLAAGDPHAVYLTQAEGDARYPLTNASDPYPQYLTQTEGDARYLQTGTAATTYLALAGGTLVGNLVVSAALVNLQASAASGQTLRSQVGTESQPRFSLRGDGQVEWGPGGGTVTDATLKRTGVATLALTGHLNPNATGTYDFGTTSLRWRKLWGADADLSATLVVATSITVASKAVALSPNANQTLQWLANGFYSDAPTKAQYDALVARVTALEGQMGAGANGHYHLMGSWRQTAKATLPATVLEEAPAA